MSALGIGLGRRFGRIGWPGPGGEPVVAGSVELTEPTEPGSSLAQLLELAPPSDAPNAPDASAAEGSGRQVALSLPPSDGQELALRRAALDAGLTVTHTLPEPVAVALHYGAVAEGADSALVVCDQGARTLDLTLLVVSGDRTVRIMHTATHPLGGDSWDEAIAAELLRQIAGDRPVDPADPDPALRRAAEDMRLGLADEDPQTRQLTWQERESTIHLDRDTAARLVAPLRTRAEQAITDFLGDAAELLGTAPATMLLAGGLNATPGTAETLEERTGAYVRCTNPESAVVRGLVLRGDFGALRVLSGRQAREAPPRTQTWTAPGRRQDPEPPGTRQDPEPRPSTEPPETPEPGPPEPESLASSQGKEERPEPEPAPAPEPPPAPAPEPAPAPAPGPVSAPAPGSRQPTPVPVEQLQAIRRDDHLLVLWAWPDDSLNARVRWRVEGATRPLDSGDIRCSRRMYEHDGGLDLTVGRGAVTLTVEALVLGPVAGHEGASSLQVAALPPVVRYAPALRRRLRGRVATVTFETDTACELPALRIVHGTGRYRPMTAKDGRLLHEVPAQRMRPGRPLEVEFAFPATRGPSWLVCFPAVADDDGTYPDVRPAALYRLKVT